mmetsp:Transcript_19428/g.62326  ORF Transcript_19428/g.62326 Transcript_19428/m.62326 type:complete len:363 (+) Transcript_19428:311-1399(+)
MQLSLLAAPRAGMRVPAGHGVGSAVPCSQKLPSGHCPLQVGLLRSVSFPKKPAAQSKHLRSPVKASAPSPLVRGMYCPRSQIQVMRALALTVVLPTLSLKLVATMVAPTLSAFSEAYSIAAPPLSALLSSKTESLIWSLSDCSAKSPPPLFPASQRETVTPLRSSRLPSREAMPPPSPSAEELRMVTPRRTAVAPLIRREPPWRHRGGAGCSPSPLSARPLTRVMSPSSVRWQPFETRKWRERPPASRVALASGLLRIERVTSSVHSSSSPPREKWTLRCSCSSRGVPGVAAATRLRSCSTLSTRVLEGRSGGSGADGGGEGGAGGLGGGEGGGGRGAWSSARPPPPSTEQEARGGRGGLTP